MTDQELIDYYTNLLIVQYYSKPKAQAHIAALAGIGIVNQLPLAVQNAFTLGIAIGAQLDVIGKYVGVSRNGFNLSGPVVLNDGDFTTLIFIKIMLNHYDGTLAGLQSMIADFFPGVLFVFDYKNMQMSYYLSSSGFSASLAQFIVLSGYLVKNMGVQLGATIGNFSNWRGYLPSLTTFYGYRTFDTPAQNVSGMNSYSSYSMNSPWLSYQDAIG